MQRRPEIGENISQYVSELTGAGSIDNGSSLAATDDQPSSFKMADMRRQSVVRNRKQPGNISGR